jgi:hypothetical protein
MTSPLVRYQKRPVIVDAEQFFLDRKPWPQDIYLDCHGRPAIDTLEGPLQVSDGDWIITGIQGERYPCKPDIFEATYETVMFCPMCKAVDSFATKCALYNLMEFTCRACGWKSEGRKEGT